MLILIFFFNMNVLFAQTETRMISLEELADRREKEEQEEKRSLFGSKTLEKVVARPDEKVSDKSKVVVQEKKSCEVVQYNGRKGVAVAKRYLEKAACQDLCIERAHPEKITHCFYDRQVIWKSNQ